MLIHDYQVETPFHFSARHDAELGIGRLQVVKEDRLIRDAGDTLSKGLLNIFVQ